MNEQSYTLAMYRVKDGKEDDFITGWDELAETFSSLADPPLWGTLIRHKTNRTLFYSFGPWRKEEHVLAMRSNSGAKEAFAKLQKLCIEMMPGDYEIIRHVVVQGNSSPEK